jgi:hypothetical protein
MFRGRPALWSIEAYHPRLVEAWGSEKEGGQPIASVRPIGCCGVREDVDNRKLAAFDCLTDAGLAEQVAARYSIDAVIDREAVPLQPPQNFRAKGPPSDA